MAPVHEVLGPSHLHSGHLSVLTGGVGRSMGTMAADVSPRPFGLLRPGGENILLLHILERGAEFRVIP